MAEFFDKLKTIIMGTPDEYDEYDDEYDEYDDDEYDEYDDDDSSRSRFSFSRGFGRRNDDVPQEDDSSRGYGPQRRKNNVIDINAQVKMSVVVATPKSIEAASEITTDLKDNKTVIVNLENMERDIAQRITDFLSGSCFALGGSIKQISSRIYIIGPYDVAITGEFKEELAASGINLPNSVFRSQRSSR